ncbi:lysophospholipid acyltransferase family protein [Aestuariibius sp. 2305UL40-4]|uniref:lysophospholipid acyltransferase family protein n=1 Tax=Aestuariibius violaceus TaxID=3234132 RepID=UPI00345E1E74
MIQYLRSLIFVGQMYLMMALMGLAFLPLALASPKGARFACKTYCRWVRWTARWMVGLETEVRGPIPTEEVLIAAKHQSFLDIILIFGAVPAGKFIMKRELMWAPVIGQYALRIGCVPVNRGKRSEAIRRMVVDVEKGRLEAGQLIIYPQGTRIAPGVSAPYKVGTAVLYQETGQACVPAATNVGVFWPRKGIMRRPGLAVVEFLPAIPPGQGRVAFLEKLERVVEEASQKLLAEANFKVDTLSN